MTPDQTIHPRRSAAAGHLPDGLLRRIIRRRLAEQIERLSAAAGDGDAAALSRHAAALAAGPLAVHKDAANRQHYELPTAFFTQFLGPRLKYSCCLWPPGAGDLAAAEEAMLELTCARAGLEDGMEVLDLGCGWGSLALFIAERFPRCRVTAMSNSRTQALHIAAAGAQAGTRPSRRSPPTSPRTTPADASIVSSRWRCLSTCATTVSCSRG